MISQKAAPGFAIVFIVLCAFTACKKSALSPVVTTTDNSLQTAFGNNINLSSLENYALQTIPKYITRNNSGTNFITDAGATLGRVLFYDKNLSVNNTISCSSCHKQSLAFSDSAIQSIGVSGLTTRHSMRLANTGFTQEARFFWDKRATSLEDQTTQPIQNHIEMGFSGANGDPGINVLTAKLQAIAYYKTLFTFVYGDPIITQSRLQNALAQFIRSIQSFDSKFDAGLAAGNNLNADFSNFTAQENLGKQLYLAPPSPPGVAVATGAGCQGCHRAPEFDIDPNSRNNGIIGVAGSTLLTDLTNTNPPSLRNLLNTGGKANGVFMHDGSLKSLAAVINHYNQIPLNPANTNIDPRLAKGPQGQNLRLSQLQKDAIVAFLATLSGNDVYKNKKWSSPFVSQ